MQDPSNRRHLAGNLLVLFVTIILCAVLAEAGAQYYAYKIVKQGKLFRPDNVLGWALLSNLDLTRLNSDGDLWHIATDDQGIRGPSSWPADTERRMIVLGDSFAFGEGVDLEKRFDTSISKQIPSLSIVNLGVMGYGTDQQLISLRPWADQLRQGDILLILTYINDFFDIASTKQSGRSKPWFEIRNGELAENGPRIGWIEIARDRSYLLSRLATLINVDQDADRKARIAQAGHLYQQIVVSQVTGLLDRGIKVVIAHHGDRVFDLPFDLADVFTSACTYVTSCLALDPALSEHPRTEIFLNDGHWADGGHQVAADQIIRHLSALMAADSRESETALNDR